MNFSDVIAITIPEGAVKKVVSGVKVLWGEQKYLKISPELIWLSPSAENDVLSNTDWQIT